MTDIKLAPAGLKAIQPYLKIAEEHDKRDPAIAYWCRLYAVQTGLKINDKSPENSAFFLNLMDWLESVKKLKREDDVITNEVVAQAHIENYALKLFLWADNEDRSGRFNKNVVKAFYTAGFIYDVVSTFGELSEEVTHHIKYSKWKSTYIHNCLKNGITPIAGPVAMDQEDEFADLNEPAPPSQPSVQPPQNLPYPSGGLFNVPSYQPENLNVPVPGTHAPPSTPNGSCQLPEASSSAASAAVVFPDQSSGGDVALKPEDFHRAQKYCKWAGSALQYEDAATAITNLQKALRLLTTGQDE